MRTSTYDAWDRALGSRLGLILKDYRANGKSYDAIADSLRDDHDVRVSRSTVARWVAIAEAS